MEKSHHTEPQTSHIPFTFPLRGCKIIDHPQRRIAIFYTNERFFIRMIQVLANALHLFIK